MLCHVMVWYGMVCMYVYIYMNHMNIFGTYFKSTECGVMGHGIQTSTQNHILLVKMDWVVSYLYHLPLCCVQNRIFLLIHPLTSTFDWFLSLNHSVSLRMHPSWPEKLPKIRAKQIRREERLQLFHHVLSDQWPQWHAIGWTQHHVSAGLRHWQRAGRLRSNFLGMGPAVGGIPHWHLSRWCFHYTLGGLKLPFSAGIQVPIFFTISPKFSLEWVGTTWPKNRER